MKNLEDYKQIKIVISNKDDIITCKISIPAVCSYFPHRVDVSDDVVRQLLLRRGYEVYSTMQGGRISNKSETSNLNQTWRFATKDEWSPRATTTPLKPKKRAAPAKRVRKVKQRSPPKNQ